MIRNLSHREFSRRDLERHGEPLGECVTMPKIGGGYICGGGGKGSTPPAPDYTAAAQAQGNSSKEVTNMQNYANRPTQNTPWGSVTWDAQAATDPATGQAVTQWTQNYNLTPEAQKALNSQLNVQSNRSQLAEGMLNRLGDAYSKPFDWNNLPKAGTTVQGPSLSTLAAPPELQKSVNTQAVRNNINPQAVQSTVNFADNPALQGGTGADRQRIENALFDRMQPIHDRQQSALDVKLANQGITAGSEAYKRAEQALGDQQSRERYDALQTAGSEIQRLADIQRANRSQMTNEDLAGANLYNSANQQAFGQDLASANLYNTANQQRFAQDLAAGQFANQANLNQFGMAKDQAGFNNQVGQQQYQNAFQQSQYANQLRQQAIAEQQQQRSQPLNELNALLTGQQVNMQQMPGFNAASAAQPVNYLGAAQSQYQAGLDAYNANSMNQNSMMNGLFGLGGSLGSAGIMASAMPAATPFMFSDSRLKKIVAKIGEKNGIGWYLFKYLGSDTVHEGAIAQEVQKVKPEAVKRHANGYLMVNYAALEA